MLAGALLMWMVSTEWLVVLVELWFHSMWKRCAALQKATLNTDLLCRSLTVPGIPIDTRCVFVFLVQIFEPYEKNCSWILNLVFMFLFSVYKSYCYRCKSQEQLIPFNWVLNKVLSFLKSLLECFNDSSPSEWWWIIPLLWRDWNSQGHFHAYNFTDGQSNTE